MSNSDLDTCTAHLEVAARVLEAEANAVLALRERLDESFSEVVEAILSATGRVAIAGIGKSGLIGRKISATMASTGTPSFFIHPGEAFHGDLGMVMPEDIFLGISNSGETREVVEILPYLRQSGNTIVALTGNPESTLARNSDYHLDIGVSSEACSLNIVPSSSTTATLAMGDALAIALMEARNFTARDFVKFHPSGSLGLRLSRVEQVMQQKNLPWVDRDSGVMEVIRTISAGKLGLALVHDENQVAIITDGDVRRGMEKYDRGFFDLSAKDLMTSEPHKISANSLMGDAIELMDELQISSLIVVKDSEVVGLVSNQPKNIER